MTTTPDIHQAPGVERTPRGQIALFGRGVAMGLAEVVPGVSGGTIAFITGIYDELVRSLAAFSGLRFADGSPWHDGWAGFARRYNLAFFAVLGAGMAVGFVALAQLMLVLLEGRPVFVAGFFFGLIAASVLYVGAQSNWRWLLTLGVVGLGLGLVATALGEPGAVRTGAPTAMFFVGGALAATAWVLPGVSGAFVLLLMGLYKPTLEALTGLDVAVIAAFAAGLVIGLLAFSKLLSWLLERARAAVLALLTGFMAGSLVELWPFRQGSIEQAALLAVLLAMAAGALTVGVLAYATRGNRP